MLNEQAFFDVLSDETRRRILALLTNEDELCVCELFFALDIPQPKVSRHLGVMRDAGLLAPRKEGTWVFYCIHPQLPLWAARILAMMAQGVEQVDCYRQDAKKLSLMANRPIKCCA